MLQSTDLKPRALPDDAHDHPWKTRTLGSLPFAFIFFNPFKIPLPTFFPNRNSHFQSAKLLSYCYFRSWSSTEPFYTNDRSILTLSTMDSIICWDFSQCLLEIHKLASLQTDSVAYHWFSKSATHPSPPIFYFKEKSFCPGVSLISPQIVAEDLRRFSSGFHAKQPGWNSLYFIWMSLESSYGLSYYKNIDFEGSRLSFATNHVENAI